MITSFGAQAYITRSRRYKTIINASKQQGEEEEEFEREGLISSVSSLNFYNPDERNFSVAFIFVVTLVSSSSVDYTLFLTSALQRLSSHLLQH